MPACADVRDLNNHVVRHLELRSDVELFEILRPVVAIHRISDEQWSNYKFGKRGDEPGIEKWILNASRPGCGLKIKRRSERIVSGVLKRLSGIKQSIAAADHKPAAFERRKRKP